MNYTSELPVAIVLEILVTLVNIELYVAMFTKSTTCEQGQRAYKSNMEFTSVLTLTMGTSVNKSESVTNQTTSKMKITLTLQRPGYPCWSSRLYVTTYLSA